MSRATCYYDILEVQKDASDSDLKKAYRRLALQLHPDKHSEENREEATLKFSLLQHAYEVLSDPQERSWYDSHRDSIIGNASNLKTPGDGGPGVDDLKPYFSRSVFNSFTDEDKGFFKVFQKLFKDISKKEELSPPTFGTSYFEYPEEVKPFYDFWFSFSTTRSFSWHDIYKPSDAPDRRVRRLMEKDNSKLREQAKKEFNNTVRTLAEYVQKRDPRYKTFLELKEKKLADKKKAAQELKAAKKLSKAKSSGLNQSFQLPSWAQLDEAEIEEIENLDDWSYSNQTPLNQAGSEGLVGGEEDANALVNELDLYCPACDKFFDSFKQQEHHLETKKHFKMVEKLRAQLLEEEKDIDFDFQTTFPSEVDVDLTTNQNFFPLQSDGENTSDQTFSYSKLEHDFLDSDLTSKLYDLNLSELGKSKKNKKKKKVINTFDLLEENFEDLQSNNISYSKSKKKSIPQPDTDLLEETLSNTNFDEISLDNSESPESLKKLKREKRKAKKNNAAISQLICNVCKENFDTRNKLFSHIRVTGHAQA